MYPIDPFQQPSPDDTPLHGDDKPARPRQAAQRQLALMKQGRRYVFDYVPGQEEQLLQRLVEMAGDPTCSLGMFDAAVLSHQIGRGLSQQVQEWLQ